MNATPRLARRLGASLALGCLLAATGPAQASLVWSWDLLEWNPTVGPTDTISLNAVLVNEASSTEHITWASLQGFWVNHTGDGTYTYATPTVGLDVQFAGVDLAPGESFEFVFGRYLPSAAPVAEGQYWGDSFGIAMRDAAGKPSSWTPDHSYLITVAAQGDPGGSVPEPGVPSLLAAALGALAFTRRQRRPGR